MIVEQFLDQKSEEIKGLCYPVYDLILSVHPCVSAAWKWNTLVFIFGKKILTYFSIKKGHFHIGFWHKEALTIPIIYRDLKKVGYYLVSEITEELMADIFISVNETIVYYKE